MNALVRLLAWLVAVALVALPVVAVLNGWVGADRWPLTRLHASGQFENVDDALLRQTLLPYARDGFFAVRLHEAQAAVAALPWVEHAEVRKRWPDVLEVRVIEHEPFAHWGEDRLLSRHGRLFQADGVVPPAGLPRLAGPDTQVEEVVALYNESRSLLGSAGMEVQAVALDARGNWTLGLGNGTEVVVGRSEARTRLARFARIAPRLLGQQEQVLVRADLRYTNGFALSWAPAPQPDQQEAA